MHYYAFSGRIAGAEYEADKAQTKDSAGGGPAEERTCTRGRGMRLLKIGGITDLDVST